MNKSTILIVEDEAIVAADLSGRLGQLGYEVVGIAAKGEEAVELACSLMPEVVLMDIHLKGKMDGIEAAEAIRRHVDLPVIYLTAHADSATLERAKLSQGFGVILKPFEERELSTTIEIALYKHQADRQLREQREWLRGTLTSIADAVITCDIAGRVNFINPVAEELIGWSIEEARDWSIRDLFRLINEQTGQPADDSLARVTRERHPTTFAGHTALVARDGREIPVEESAAPILSADGRTVGVVLVFRDVTEKRRAQEMLQESEARLQEAYDSLQHVNQELHAQNLELALLWKESMQTREELAESRERLQFALTSSGMATFNWEIVENSRTRASELPGLKGNDQLTLTGSGEDFLRAIHPEDRSTVLAALSRSIETRGEYETEYRVVGPDDTIRFIAARGKTYPESAGQAVRMAGISWDITERVAGETALMMSNQRLDLLAEIAGKLLASNSPQEIVDSLCRTVMDFLDCQVFFNFLVDGEQDCLQLNACAGIPEEEARRIERLEYGVAVCGCAARDACRIVAENIPETPDPRTDLVKSYGIKAYACHPLMVQGRVLGTLSFGTRSRTEFSSDDLALMKSVADHVAIAMERKQVEEELRLARDTSGVAIRAKSQFLANMSHELRTPMTGVLGMLDLALSGNLEEEQREFIETAQTSARSMVRILNDILDLTKIEKGKFSIEEKPFSIRKCLQHTINILVPVAKNKGFDLNLWVDDEVPECIVGDQVRLSHVLTNLAGNAVKFTEKGKVELQVTAGGSAPADKREVIFTISDTGIGIPDDKKCLLFRVFSQVDESHSRTYGGTGLGLAISKEIVERMGGTISFTSEVGKGSTFTFTIPFGVAEADRESGCAPGRSAAAWVAPQPGETEKPRLLVAEDDQTIIQVLGSMLRMARYEVDFAENGQKAIEMWEDGEYDLILMDIQMPQKNGFEATAAIRGKERTCGGHIPIVAMTAHAFKEDEKRCLDAGMDAYISKPIDFMACLQLIRENLNKALRQPV